MSQLATRPDLYSAASSTRIMSMNRAAGSFIEVFERYVHESHGLSPGLTGQSGAHSWDYIPMRLQLVTHGYSLFIVEPTSVSQTRSWATGATRHGLTVLGANAARGGGCQAMGVGLPAYARHVARTEGAG
jgi:hypothetical protein